ncbi:MAG: PEP-CTERM sorting domain-containing protein [Candidatus Acidiferrales bacterium]
MAAHVVLTVAFLASPVRADTDTWNFSQPAGTLGTSQNYAVEGTTITASGYSQPNKLTDLFGKTAGGDQSGTTDEPQGRHLLGINGEVHSEIAGTAFIQLDLTQLVNAGFKNGQLEISSVQPGEHFNIWGSNQKGVLGTLLVANGSLDTKPFSIPDFGKFDFISITSPKGDVLVDSLSAQPPSPSPVPEPSTLVLLLTGAVGMGGFVRWKLKHVS